MSALYRRWHQGRFYPRFDESTELRASAKGTVGTFDPLRHGEDTHQPEDEKSDGGTFLRQGNRLVAIGGAIVVVIVLTLAAPSVGHGSGYDEGHRDGVTQGFTDGQEVGYEEGFAAGEDQGHDRGFAEGRQAGEEEGHDQGYGVGRDEGYTIGLEEGETEGYDRGYEDGLLDGYDEGYDDGYSDCQAEAC